MTPTPAPATHPRTGHPTPYPHPSTQEAPTMSTPTPAPTPSAVHLGKAMGVEQAPDTAPSPRRLPPVGAPLYSHRYGLRMNDPVVLHSALVILAQRGGTAHRIAHVHTVGECLTCK